MNYRRGKIEIDAGFGFITQVEGVPGLSADLAYTCTMVMPDGVFEGIEHQIPCAGRYPAPIEVDPHPVNVPFPAYRVNRQFQTYMLPESPQLRPCPGGPSSTGNILALIAAMDQTQRAILRNLIMEGA